MEKDTQNFEHRELEADMQRLSQEILEKRKLSEYKDLSNKEIIKEIIRPLINPEKQRANIENNAAIETREKDFLPDYALEFPAEKKLEVEKLVDRAVFHKELFKVVAEIKNGKYKAEIIDIFHDALADKLEKELKQKKLL